MINYIKKFRKTLFLKITLIAMMIPIVLLSCVAAPQMLIEAIQSDEVNIWFVMSFSVFMFLLLFPYAIAVFQTFILFINIEKGEYYSKKSVRNFDIIKYCAIIALILFIAMLPSIFYFSEIDDAPGLALLGLIFVFASGSIAVFATVMKDLVLESGIKQ